MSSKSVILIAVSTLGGLTLIAVVVWLLRRSTYKSENLKSARPSTGSSQSSEKQVEFALSEALSPFYSSTPVSTNFEAPTLESLALEVPNADLREYLREIACRIRDEGPNFNSKTSIGFIEEMVDRIDDLTVMINKQDKQVSGILVSFNEAVVRILSACGAELIYSTVWDPSLQRAIAKEVIPGIDVPRIQRFGSTGFRRHDQLIRKQEVILAMPEII